MTAPVTCATCRWWEPHTHDETKGQGECRRHAPITFAVSSRVETVWPITWFTDWCGDHARNAAMSAPTLAGDEIRDPARRMPT